MYSIRLTRSFQRDVKRLRKKYRRLTEDLKPLVDELSKGDFSRHEAIKGFSHKVYKARVRSSDQGKGKRGGFRVIYYVVVDDTEIFLLSIYAKARKSDIDSDYIKKIVDDDLI